MRKVRNRLVSIGLIAVGAGSLWSFDKYFYYSTIQRNLLTLGTGILITIDYKLNFTASKAEAIDQLHERTAKRILNVCKSNGGLYIKFGQQIASVPVMPKPYMIYMKQLYDKAPYFDYSIVEQIFQKDFGVTPDKVFADFSEIPVASASIAQVHKATLKDGTAVAVKIQKPAIQKQIFWDMVCYRVVIYAFEKLFDLPVYWTADYIEKHLVQETDFLNEVQNSEKCFQNIQETSLKDRVYVPKNYHDICSRHVMTSEWIEGVPLTNKTDIIQLGLSVPRIMTHVVNVFADQIFRTGLVHADPHPGNILVRKHPTKRGEQVVLLDHGLYVQCTKEFTHQYALFWKSLFTLDMDLTRSVTESWGIKNPTVFASATLARPWKSGKALHIEQTTIQDIYESQVNAKDQVSKFLKDSQNLPKELIFVGRNLNCVRANNKILGSPVNRIKLMAYSAVENLDNNNSSSFFATPWNYIIRNYNYLVFHSTLTLISIAHFATNWYNRLSGKMKGGFETVLEQSLKEQIARQFPGMAIDENAFDG